MMEEKLDQITSSSREQSKTFDDQISALATKQINLEVVTKTLKKTMNEVKASHQVSCGSVDREEEYTKLREHLARSVVELEAMATTTYEVERRFASEEQQLG